MESETIQHELFTSSKKLHPLEEHYRIPGPISGLNLFLRFVPGTRAASAPHKSILFLHGMSFPSALSIAHRFDGRSWRDELCEAGFDVWALDFYGFGEADRYAEMSQPAEINPPLGRAEELSSQIEYAVRFICKSQNLARISLIAHSAGTIAAGRFATLHPELVDRMVFFAPIGLRDRTESVSEFPLAWRLVSLKDQWDRFTQDVPHGETNVLSNDQFRLWGEAYLATDPEAHTRNPASVKVPNGMQADIQAAWDGQLRYDPREIQTPILIIRGEWDTVCSSADAKQAFNSLRSLGKRNIEISRATHLMHLESSRFDLYRETTNFLEGESMQTQGNTNDQPTGSRSPAISGYDYGKENVSHSPISIDELRKLEQSVGWSEEDANVLNRHRDFFHAQAEAMVDSWRAVIGAQPQLAQWFFGPNGKPDDEYKARVKNRFVQWVKDVCDRSHDQTWLDYQEEIGLRHTPAKKNLTDHVHTPPVVPLRYLFGFTSIMTTETNKFFEKLSVSKEEVKRIEIAWTRAVILHVTLWSRPFTKDGLW
jgi:pimeloyl-ACP methyl ester carboxylesterase